MSKKLLVIAALLAGGGAACWAVLKPAPKPGESEEWLAERADPVRIQEHFEALEERLAKLERGETLNLQELRIKELEAQVTGLKAEVTKLKSAPQAGPSATTGKAGPLAKLDAAPADLKEEVLAAVKKDIDSAVEEKTKEMARKLRRRGPGGGEVQLDELVTSLKLDGRQKLAVENEAREAQRKARFLMDTPTDDGTRLIDVLANAMALQRAGRPEAGGQFMRFFSSMQKEVPGTGRSYGEMLREVSQTSMKAIRQELNPEQLEDLKDMRVDPQRIQGISDSPFADLEGMVQAQVDKLKEGEKGS